MFKRRRGISLGLALWLVVGVVMAIVRGYVTSDLLASVGSAVLAILLWPLLFLGIDLRIG
ncbi:MAG: hypothetical protein ACFCVG_02010 [Kineosporiaceae bacterium]